ncbi:MAG: AMP-binding protein, partial [Lachnospiraceae bacterium]|nr:AMP-binding protein [Candidatus Equihabitans merdae]
KQLKMWMEKLPDTTFVNLYGPSEITCNCTYHVVQGKAEDINEKLPIGIPFPGRQIYLMNDNMQLVPEGESGEICVAGESLSSGYINNETETAKRFKVVDIDGVATRIYCTGDLGYYKDGLLVFAGRKDFQIKYMGHRIEIEEIEAAIDKVDGVDRSICLFHEEKNRLVAFYMGSIEARDLKKKLRDSLPNFMVPAKIFKEDSMPLNKNGKTDRKYFKAKLEA